MTRNVPFILAAIWALSPLFMVAQSASSSPGTQVMTPELLWELNRVSPIGMSSDRQYVVYKVTQPSVLQNDFTSQYYKVSIQGNTPPEPIKEPGSLVRDPNLSPDSQLKLVPGKVKLAQVLGADLYPELDQSDVYRYDALDYRHWDRWEDGTYNHIFVEDLNGDQIDVLKDMPYHCPQKPFGGGSDYIWSPDGKKVVYVAKKLTGTAYALSTNTDLFEFDIYTRATRNLTTGMMGYDTDPAYNSNGDLAWLSMERDGYEADKNNIMLMDAAGIKTNLTRDWDGTVKQFRFSKNPNELYFIAPVVGTLQLFKLSIDRKNKIQIEQITDGIFDISHIIGIENDRVIVLRSDMNHAADIYSYNLKRKTFTNLSKANNEVYQNLQKSNIEKRWVQTTDDESMLVWVIYPPNFDPKKTYPTLLYCQGGPQSALSQFYSFRWNFQLMAAQGYIVVAPNRRGMPGHGVKWNEQISKDWGGQVMDDYLSAINDIKKEPYVDQSRIGAVGASFGGYSVFYLAGIHNGLFKTFISHCGVFNLESMYGTTEEVFFTNFDLGGPYWDLTNPDVQKAYNDFNPIKKVQNWNTPMLIIQGGKDYRVPIGQGQEAFQAAQLLGIKSRFLYFPEENHWVLTPQNALVWQREFFTWLKETL